jgi:ABC-2 type transport system ATP-binding protein
MAQPLAGNSIWSTPARSRSPPTGGMRRRLDLAMTLVERPRIIFLDEPTTGLDPRSRHTMWQIIRNLVAGGDTIFLTTQHLEEADQLADSIAVLDLGKFVAQGTSTGTPEGCADLAQTWASSFRSRIRDIERRLVLH